MKSMRATVLLSALAAILTLACAVPHTKGTGRAGNPTDAAERARAQDAIRDFSVTSFSGDDFTLSAERGSPVVLNFFESW